MADFCANLYAGKFTEGSGDGGKKILNQDITVTDNGTYTAGDGYTGLGTVTVDLALIDSPKVFKPKTTQVEWPASAYGAKGFKNFIIGAVDSTIDANIVADNIKAGVSILGVAGSYTGGGGRTDLPVMIDNGILYNTVFADGGQGTVDYKFPDDVIELNLTGLFDWCPSLKSIDFNNIEVITNFTKGVNECYNLSEVKNFSKIKTIGSLGAQSMFASSGSNSGGVLTIDVSGLVTVGFSGMSNCFSNTTIEELRFTNLVNLGQVCFSGMCSYSKIKALYFNALKTTSFPDGATDCFCYMLSGCTDVTVHFPSNLESVLSTWEDVQNGFDGENTTVLYDLPATE